MKMKSKAYKTYKWCAVPRCVSTSIKTPNKLFVYVPHKREKRINWLNLARRDPAAIRPNSPLYFCEDHFDLPNDMENFMEYHVMGSVAQVRMKPDCIPTKFDCQSDNLKRTSDTSKTPHNLKKRKKLLVDPDERSITIAHSKLGGPCDDTATSSLDQSRIPDLQNTDTSPSLFCICCLERETSYVNLVTCSHAGFLTSFMMPEIKPKDQVICNQCHQMLKKIKLFRLQVEESFRVLSDSTAINQKSSYKNNLDICATLSMEISQACNEETPQIVLKEPKIEFDVEIKIENECLENTVKPPPPTTSVEKDKRMKNIEDALKIIKSNQNSGNISLLATSLQTLSHIGSIITSGNQAGTSMDAASNIASAISTGNVASTTKDSDIAIEKLIKKEVSEDADLGQNSNNEELSPSEEDVGEINMLTDDSRIQALGKDPSVGSNIKQVKLTKEQLIKRRAKMACCQTYLRKPHRCESCLIGFQFQENLEDHVKRKHRNLGNGNPQCEVCLQFVDPGQSYDLHTSLHYTRYECVICRQQFTTCDKADLHYRKHFSYVKPGVLYKCQHCPFKSRQLCLLRKHLRVGAKCNLCDARLGCATGVRNHITCCKRVPTKAKRGKNLPTSTGRLLKNTKRNPRRKKDVTSAKSD